MRRSLGISLALALLLASCGGGGDDSGSSSLTATVPSSPQKDALIAKADKACASANQKIFRINVEIQELNKNRGSSTLAKQAAPLYARAQKVGRQVLADLRSLEPPAADRAAYNAYVAAAAKQIGLVARTQRALEQNDTKKVTDLSGKASFAKQDAQALAKKFGFKVCGVS
jgi:hypothetical protein